MIHVDKTTFDEILNCFDQVGTQISRALDCLYELRGVNAALAASFLTEAIVEQKRILNMLSALIVATMDEQKEQEH